MIRFVFEEYYPIAVLYQVHKAAETQAGRLVRMFWDNPGEMMRTI